MLQRTTRALPVAPVSDAGRQIDVGPRVVERTETLSQRRSHFSCGATLGRADSFTSCGVTVGDRGVGVQAVASLIAAAVLRVQSARALELVDQDAFGGKERDM